MDEVDKLMALCEMSGVELLLSDGKPVIRGKPNQAMLAAIRQNRAEIIRRLGGDPTIQAPIQPKTDLRLLPRPQECRDCGAKIFVEPGDWAFTLCDYRNCNWRHRR